MRSASFHFAMRSPRAKLPTLSWPTPQPTARWTMVMSSVSPDRAETMPAKPACLRRLPGLQRFGQRAALVGLQQHCVGGAARAAASRTPVGVGDEEIVADDLHAGRRLPG